MSSAMRKYIVAALAAIVVIYVLTLTVGGGFSEKAPLPEALTLTGRPLLIAHRGAINFAPENTLAGIRRALERGYSVVEMDIQLSADSQFFLFHDRETDRTLGISAIATEMTIAELQSQPTLFAGQPSEQLVPTLDSAASLFSAGGIMYLDVKHHSQVSVFELANALELFLAEHDLLGKVIVASPDFWFISYFEFTCPEVVTLLAGFRRPWANYINCLPRRFRPDLYSNYFRNVTPEFAAWLKENGHLNRFVAFHLTEENFPELVDEGVRRLMIDDGPYLDSLLPQ